VGVERSVLANRPRSLHEAATQGVAFGDRDAFLREFLNEFESLKATLLVERPTAFRRRMIFVGADPLYRPRPDVPIFGM
jgi:hypothetical protein